MARAMWKGAIQFGLVTIPVKLYLATESKGISFNMLHKTDLSRIQMKVWCPVEDEPISRSDTVKGFEYAPGEYVVVTDEDLERVPLKTVRSIEIEQFAPKGDETDEHTKFPKQAYYIEPDKIGRKAFYLLREVLQKKDLTAICKVVIKDREALASMDPFGDTMLLQTLHWPDEIRSTKELDLPDEDYDFKPAETAMAEQLVEAMTADFDPAKYKDEYREALMEVIEAKLDGKEVVAAPEEPESTNLVDLMKLLEASVKQATGSKTKEEPVSVAAKRKAKDEAAAKKPAAKAKTKAADEDEAEARPARRRKSA